MQIVTDANGHRKDLEFDARENLVAVTEYLDGVGYTTRYKYDALGDLTQITDAQGNIRRMTYDLQGRKLSEEDLHTPGDSTFGTSSFSYDENGNLAQETDPKGQTVLYSYDEIDRVLTEDHTGSTGTEVMYIYDQGANGLGRLVAVMSTGAEKVFGYDILGRIIHEEQTIAGTTYVIDFAFDLLGNPLSIVYPDELVVTYGYNTAGKVESVDQDGVPVVTNVDHSPIGLVSRLDFANGVTTVNTYDPTQMFRLTRKKTEGPKGERFQDITYTFDPVGNITALGDISESNAARAAVYTYDDLDRLTSATVTATGNGADYTRTYSYDILGNMLSRSDVGAYSYAGGDASTSSGTYANPHAVTTVAGTDHTYDLNGNLASNGAWTHTWDYQDRLVSSTDGTTTITYAYDESGQRVMKLNIMTGKITLYVNRYYDLEDLNAKKHIYVGNIKVATVQGNSGGELLTATRYEEPDDFILVSGIYDNNSPGSTVADAQDGQNGSVINTFIDADEPDDSPSGGTGNAPPVLSIGEPDGINDAADSSFLITWTDDDPDDNAFVYLYSDANSTGADGRLLAVRLEDDVTDNYLWDTSELFNGDYYVYGVMDDGINPPVTVYSSGSVTVDHGDSGGTNNISPVLSITEPNGVGDTVDTSFVITWSDDDPDDDALLRFFFDRDGMGFDGRILNEQPLSEDDTADQYIWNTSAVPEGNYHIYGVIDDGMNSPVMVYSSGALTVNHGNGGGGNEPPPISRLPSIVFHHEDHLAGANVDTDLEGNAIQILDYYPFGTLRIDESATAYENDYRFTGRELDDETDLYYHSAASGRNQSEDRLWQCSTVWGV